MARCVAITEPGGIDRLAVENRQVRAAGPGEVRISVRAAAVNPTDVGLRQRGVPDLEPPWTPGMDAAGTVESVGAGVERLTPGDQVMAAVMPRRAEGGAQAELIVVPEGCVVKIPDSATLEQAATLPMNGLTAYLGLEMLGLDGGQTLAVTGGAGLLASYVIPLAKERGLRVIADAQPEDQALVASFGADVVVPRGEGFVDAVRAEVPDGVDGIYDTALLVDSCTPAIRQGGAIAVVRGWTPQDPPERGIRLEEVRVATVLERTDWLEELRELASAGRLPLRVAGEYPPEQAGEAHRVMDAGGLRGRVVIVF